MSDDATVVKRGRKANTEKAEKNDKAASPAETKKRTKKEATKDEKPVPAGGGGDEDGPVPVKRGRGRPKGSTKKKSPNAKQAKPKQSGPFNRFEFFRTGL